MTNCKWVPWKDRKDLDNRYALFSIYPNEDGYYKRDVPIGDFVFLLPTRTIPDNRIEQVKARVQTILNLCKRKCSSQTISGKVVNVDVRDIIGFPKYTELSPENRVFVNELESKGDKRSFPNYTELLNLALNEVEAIDRYEFELAAQEQNTDKDVNADKVDYTQIKDHKERRFCVGVVQYCDNFTNCPTEAFVPLINIPVEYIETVKPILEGILFDHFVYWIKGDSFKFEICLYDELTLQQKILFDKDAISGELLKEINDVLKGAEKVYRQEQAAPADITLVCPNPPLFAKGDEAAPVFDNSDNGATGTVVAGNTARLVDNSDTQIELQKKQIDQADTLIELHKREIELLENRPHTANNTASNSVTGDPAASGNTPVDHSVPEYDNPNDWISLADLAQKMADKKLSVDADAAKKHLRNKKSEGWKSPEKYDGKNSAFGVSLHGKWRMVPEGLRWTIYFYRPSMPWITDPQNN